MEPFLGEIELVGFNFAPQNWALCNGQELPIPQNVALYSLLGTTFGETASTPSNSPTCPPPPPGPPSSP